MEQQKPHWGVLWWLPTAFFAMGMGYNTIAWASVLLLESMGVEAGLTAFWTSAMLLPWTLKPLWSPLMELWGSKRSYVVWGETLVGTGFAGVGVILMMAGGRCHWWLGAAVGALIFAAFIAATADTATDGIYVTALSPRQQSRYIGWQEAFYNFGYSAGGAGVVFAAGLLSARGWDASSSWGTAMLIAAATMMGLGCYNRRALPDGAAPSAGISRPTSLGGVWRTWVGTFLGFLSRPAVGVFLAMSVVFRLPLGFMNKIVPLFLVADPCAGGMGLSEAALGVYWGTVTTIANVAGAALGGWYGSDRPLSRCFWVYALAYGLYPSVYWLLANVGPSGVWEVGVAMAASYIMEGFGFAGLLLFIMRVLCGRSAGAMAYFSFATAFTTLGIWAPGMASGWLCEALGGFRPYFATIALLVVPVVAMSLLLPWRKTEQCEI